MPAFSLLCRVSAVVLLCAGATFLPHPALAQTIPATTSVPAVVERHFTLNYKDSLLSFREDGKPYLFARTVATPTIGLRLETGTVRSGCKITLRDGTGKVLWSDAIALRTPEGKNVRGTLNFNTSTDGGLTLVLKANTADVDDGDEELSKGVLTATLRADNRLLKADYAAEDTRLHLELLKDEGGLVMTQLQDGKRVEVARLLLDKDKKTVRGIVNGKEVLQGSTDNGLILNDGTGPVTLKSIKQDGKDYTEVTIGERRLLIAGGNYNAVSKDGTIIITPTAPAPASGSK